MFKHDLIKRALAGGLVIAAASFPSAAHATAIAGQGRSVAVAPPAIGPAVQQRLEQLQRTVEQRFAAEGGWHLSAPSTPGTVTSSGGFQWDDAGIGAAGATVLLGAGALGAAVTRRHRTQRTIVG